MTKQTAANNKMLSGVKTRMNAKVYKRVLQLVNEQGESAGFEYLQRFFISPVRAMFPH